MDNTKWVEFNTQLSIIENYFKDVLSKATSFHKAGASTNNSEVAVHAKTIMKGTIGMLEYFDSMRESMFQQSGAVRIPVQNLDKPNLTIVKKGGVSNDVQSRHCTPSKPVTGSLPFGETDRA